MSSHLEKAKAVPDPSHFVKRRYDQKVFEQTYKTIDMALPRRIREDMRDHFQKTNLRRTEFNWLMLSIAEITSNLLKHPVVKPSEIEIQLFQDDYGAVFLDIIDDSTPFHDFMIEREISLKLIDQKKLNENGRGLALIAKTHPDHQYTPSSNSDDGRNHFSLWFPERAKRDIFEQKPANEKQTLKASKPSIFVIDDDAVIREILKDMLANSYEVHLFPEAQSALDAFDNMKPDMIISDLVMPGMSGSDLRRALSQKERGDLIPFIFLSANERAATDDYINQLGIDDYLVKPVRKEKLLSVIERLFKRSDQVHRDIKGQMDENIASVLSPQLPSTCGPWEFSVRSFAAKTGGGDFLFYRQDHDDKGVKGAPTALMTMTLADVMGHGLEAKFFAYAFAGYIRSLFMLFDGDCKMAKLLEYLSKAINSDPILDNTLITLLAACFYDNGAVELGCAAHPAPFRITSDQQTHQIPVKGPLPGLLGIQGYKPYDLQASSGDLLFFYTDGLFENRDGRNEQHLEKITNYIARHNADKLESLSDWIWNYHQNNILPFQHHDDATFVLIRYQEAGE